MLTALPETSLVKVLLCIDARDLLPIRLVCSTFKFLTHETVRHTYHSKPKSLKCALSGLISIASQEKCVCADSILARAFLLSAHVDPIRVVKQHRKVGGPSMLLRTTMTEWLFDRKFGAIRLLRENDVRTGVRQRCLIFANDYAEHWVGTGTPIGRFMQQNSIMLSITDSESIQYLGWRAVAMYAAFNIFGTAMGRYYFSHWSVIDWIATFKFLPLCATDVFTAMQLSECNKKFDFWADPEKHLYVHYGVDKALELKRCTANMKFVKQWDLCRVMYPMLRSDAIDHCSEDATRLLQAFGAFCTQNTVQGGPRFVWHEPLLIELQVKIPASHENEFWQWIWAMRSELLKSKHQLLQASDKHLHLYRAPGNHEHFATHLRLVLNHLNRRIS